MIERKRKICKECKEPEFLWSKGLCRSCWMRLNAKPIKSSGKAPKKQSKQGKERQKTYEAAKAKYLGLHPTCERCGSKGDLDLHHKRGRDGENRYNYFMTVCRACHQWIHEHVAEAYELGYLTSRLTNET